MILALTSDTMPVGRIYDAADSILAQKLSQVDGVGQVFVGGGARPAVRAQVDPALLSQLGIGFEEVRAALALRQRQLARRASCPMPPRRGPISANRPALRRRPVPAGDRRLPQRRAGAARRPRATVETSVEDVRTAGLANGKRAVLHHHVPAARRQHDRDGGPGARPHAAAPGVDPALDQPLGGPRPHHDHPRLVPRHPAHAAPVHRAGRARGVPLPAQRVGRRSSRAWPCRCP